MGFSNELKNELGFSYTKNLVEGFYKPVLSEAKLYQRVSAYFTSAGMDLYIEGIEELAKNGGEIQFIISKTISERDYERIKAGYDLLEEMKPLRIAERNERLSPSVQEQLGNLAFMIAMGRARVKIALTNRGDFHDKFGIISSQNEKIFFNGSVNETYRGINENYESISVDVSWDTSDKVKARIYENVERFERLWNNEEPRVDVIEASDIAYNELGKYKSLSRITESEIVIDDYSKKELSINSIGFYLINDKIIRRDSTDIMLTLNDRMLNNKSDLSGFFDDDNQTIKEGTTYRDLERIIKTTETRAKRKGISVYISPAVEEYMARNKYSIEQYKILGNVYKDDVEQFPFNKQREYQEFSNVVQSEVSRQLYELHMRAAFFEYELRRAANFSVPGAGKTAMILGVFAYLNREKADSNERVERLLVVSPISAFESWKQEFSFVFGEKKELKTIDCQSSRDFRYDLNINWKVRNLIMINYESLPKYERQIEKLLDSKTMLIFDEVHRVKNPNGVRAKSALKISRKVQFKYVLTGTPIPNAYTDIYNFLHILYANEYSSFFGWNLNALKEPRVRHINEINKALYPFFWRTNKNDLEVPKPEPDIIEIVKPSDEQLQLAETIYFYEQSSLAKLIRLIQASTNPSLVNKAIDYTELMVYDEEGDTTGISEEDFEKLLGYTNAEKKQRLYTDLRVENMHSPKFEKGINLVANLVEEGKKVLVWGIFVDTIIKITEALKNRGIKVNLVYGSTDKAIRVDLINEFRPGNVNVLVSNPQTLGEAISLHKEVHDAVYFEYNFNLTFMLQSRDRIHRLGLKEYEYTRYYYLQTEDESLTSYRPGFIDQKIYKRLKEKEQTMYQAIDNKNLSIEYSAEDILDAIRIIEDEKRRIRFGDKAN